MRLLSVLLWTLPAWAQSGGWISLPVTAGLSGWTRIAVPPNAPLKEPNQWKADPATGIILCEGNGGHEMLRFDREFSDFVLHVEWRFTKLGPQEQKYNSGVYVRNNHDGTIWHQAQAGLAGGFLFGSTQAAGAAKRFNLKAQMAENRVKPAGEWNTYEITCHGPRMSLSVNGKTVNEYNEMEVRKGFIGLEAEGYRIEFRKIRVKPL